MYCCKDLPGKRFILKHSDYNGSTRNVPAFSSGCIRSCSEYSNSSSLSSLKVVVEYDDGKIEKLNIHSLRKHLYVEQLLVEVSPHRIPALVFNEPWNVDELEHVYIQHFGSRKIERVSRNILRPFTFKELNKETLHANVEDFSLWMRVQKTKLLLLKGPYALYPCSLSIFNSQTATWFNATLIEHDLFTRTLSVMSSLSFELSNVDPQLSEVVILCTDIDLDQMLDGVAQKQHNSRYQKKDVVQSEVLKMLLWKQPHWLNATKLYKDQFDEFTKSFKSSEMKDPLLSPDLRPQVNASLDLGVAINKMHQPRISTRRTLRASKNSDDVNNDKCGSLQNKGRLMNCIELVLNEEENNYLLSITKRQEDDESLCSVLVCAKPNSNTINIPPETCISVSEANLPCISFSNENLNTKHMFENEISSNRRTTVKSPFILALNEEGNKYLSSIMKRQEDDESLSSVQVCAKPNSNTINIPPETCTSGSEANLPCISSSNENLNTKHMFENEISSNRRTAVKSPFILALNEEENKYLSSITKRQEEDESLSSVQVCVKPNSNTINTPPDTCTMVPEANLPCISASNGDLNINTEPISKTETSRNGRTTVDTSVQSIVDHSEKTTTCNKPTQLQNLKESALRKQDNLFVNSCSQPFRNTGVSVIISQPKRSTAKKHRQQLDHDIPVTRSKSILLPSIAASSTQQSYSQTFPNQNLPVKMPSLQEAIEDSKLVCRMLKPPAPSSQPVFSSVCYTHQLSGIGSPVNSKLCSISALVSPVATVKVISSVNQTMNSTAKSTKEVSSPTAVAFSDALPKQLLSDVYCGTTKRPVCNHSTHNQMRKYSAMNLSSSTNSTDGGMSTRKDNPLLVQRPPGEKLSISPPNTNQSVNNAISLNSDEHLISYILLVKSKKSNRNYLSIAYMQNYISRKQLSYAGIQVQLDQQQKLPYRQNHVMKLHCLLLVINLPKLHFNQEVMANEWFDDPTLNWSCIYTNLNNFLFQCHTMYQKFKHMEFQEERESENEILSQRVNYHPDQLKNGESNVCEAVPMVNAASFKSKERSVYNSSVTNVYNETSGNSKLLLKANSTLPLLEGHCQPSATKKTKQPQLEDSRRGGNLDSPQQITKQIGNDSIKSHENLNPAGHEKFLDSFLKDLNMFKDPLQTQDVFDSVFQTIPQSHSQEQNCLGFQMPPDSHKETKPSSTSLKIVLPSKSTNTSTSSVVSSQFYIHRITPIKTSFSSKPLPQNAKILIATAKGSAVPSLLDPCLMVSSAGNMRSFPLTEPKIYSTSPSRKRPFENSPHIQHTDVVRDFNNIIHKYLLFTAKKANTLNEKKTCEKPPGIQYMHPDAPSSGVVTTDTYMDFFPPFQTAPKKKRKQKQKPTKKQNTVQARLIGDNVSCKAPQLPAINTSHLPVAACDEQNRKSITQQVQTQNPKPSVSMTGKHFPCDLSVVNSLAKHQIISTVSSNLPFHVLKLSQNSISRTKSAHLSVKDCATLSPVKLLCATPPLQCHRLFNTLNSVGTVSEVASDKTSLHTTPICSSSFESHSKQIKVIGHFTKNVTATMLISTQSACVFSVTSPSALYPTKTHTMGYNSTNVNHTWTPKEALKMNMSSKQFLKCKKKTKTVFSHEMQSISSILPVTNDSSTHGLKSCSINYCTDTQSQSLPSIKELCCCSPLTQTVNTVVYQPISKENKHQRHKQMPVITFSSLSTDNVSMLIRNAIHNDSIKNISSEKTSIASVASKKVPESLKSVDAMSISHTQLFTHGTFLNFMEGDDVESTNDTLDFICKPQHALFPQKHCDITTFNENTKPFITQSVLNTDCFKKLQLETNTDPIYCLQSSDMSPQSVTDVLKSPKPFTNQPTVSNLGIHFLTGTHPNYNANISLQNSPKLLVFNSNGPMKDDVVNDQKRKIELPTMENKRFKSDQTPVAFAKDLKLTRSGCSQHVPNASVISQCSEKENRFHGELPSPTHENIFTTNIFNFKSTSANDEVNEDCSAAQVEMSPTNFMEMFTNSKDFGGLTMNAMEVSKVDNKGTIAITSPVKVVLTDCQRFVSNNAIVVDDSYVKKKVKKKFWYPKEVSEEPVSHLQTKSCSFYPKLPKCTDCRADEPDSYCRFTMFRRLTNDNEVSGFCTPADAEQWDLKHWLFDKTNVDLSIETSKQILQDVGAQFQQLVNEEVSAQQWGGKKDALAWKRAVLRVREMCDVCATTIFNTHWTCDACGFGVCLDCFLVAVKSQRETSKSDHVWPICQHGELHEAQNLTVTCIVPRDVLVGLQNELLQVCKRIGLKFNQLDLLEFSHPKSLMDSMRGTPDSLSNLDILACVANQANDNKALPAPNFVHDVRNIFDECEKITESLPEECLWFCNNRMLHIQRVRFSEKTMRLFQSEWRKGRPILVSNVDKLLQRDLWSPESFLRDFGRESNDVINCYNGDIIENFSVWKFWKGFESVADRPILKEPVALLKLKDWPSGDDFQDKLPKRFQDIMQALPVPFYTNRKGQLNLAARLPDFFAVPDLGPKMYNAYGSASYPSAGTTNLHLDISDATNVIVYVGIPRDREHRQKEIDDTFEIVDCSCCESTQRRIRQPGVVPGALWHIFPAHSAEKIRQFLRRISIERGIVLNDVSDPIHDQSFYLDQVLLKRLEEEEGVVGYAICQCLGDAVFIPAGAPHQVLNLHSCIKIAEDFVGPEHLSHCIQLTQEFRHLSEFHTNHEDKLQIKNILFHTVKDCLGVLKVHYKL